MAARLAAKGTAAVEGRGLRVGCKSRGGGRGKRVTGWLENGEMGNSNFSGQKKTSFQKIKNIRLDLRNYYVSI